MLSKLVLALALGVFWLVSPLGCGGDESQSSGSGAATAAGGSGGDAGAANPGGNGGSGGVVDPPKTDPHISGDYMRWHTLSFLFDGPSASEGDSAPNPFMDYRLQVHLTGPGGASFVVPGFFDGDGDGGDTGNRWAARFVPNQVGEWSFVVSFVAAA